MSGHNPDVFSENQALLQPDQDPDQEELAGVPQTLPVQVYQLCSRISIDLVAVYFSSARRKEPPRTRCFLLLLSLLLVAGLGALSAYFVLLGKDDLDNSVKHCSKLAYWFYVSGWVTASWLVLIQIVGLIWRRDEADSAEPSTAAYLLYIFQFGWCIHGITLLLRHGVMSTDPAASCMHLYWPLWYIFGVALPAIVGLSCCLGCSIISVMPKKDTYDE